MEEYIKHGYQSKEPDENNDSILQPPIGGTSMQDEKNVDELKELITNILKEVSKFHPDYPVYGYDYVDGKLVSVVREQHEYL